MPVELTTRAVDKSTYIVTCSFSDENGDAVVPNTLTWTLTDEDGTVINDREDVEVSVPAASYDIVLSGDDLKYSDSWYRVLTIEATYDSDAGDDLPLRESCKFSVDDLVAI
jgi:hypothetical protein